MISIVIPAHNEADEIGGLLEAFGAFAGVELIVAEDASTDGTPDIVREFASRNDNVVLTSSSTLGGKRAAVSGGLRSRQETCWDSSMGTDRSIQETSCASQPR